MNAAHAPGSFLARYRWLRLIASLALITLVALWIIRDGTLLSRLGLIALGVSVGASAITSALHALGVQVTAKVYRRHVGFGQALRICLLGTIGNSMGGLPIGTTLKYVFLNRHVNLSLAQITAGLIAITVGIAFFLLTITAITGLTLDIARPVKVTLLASVPATALGLFVAVRWAAARPKTAALTKPLITSASVGEIAGLTFVLAATFVANSSIVGTILLPDVALTCLIFISAAGILLGLSSLLQPVAGIQELALGLAAFSSGIPAVAGAQIALVMRFGAIVSSSLMLAAPYLSTPLFRRKNAASRD